MIWIVHGEYEVDAVGVVRTEGPVEIVQVASKFEGSVREFETP